MGFLSATDARPGVAFIGNYLPRACGIATFTTDLANAVGRRIRPGNPVTVVAMNDRFERYNYPNSVAFQIRDDHPGDYALAADFLNKRDIDVVSLQHEFGIFGGQWGDSILVLLRKLRKPVVTTLHSVPEEPDPGQERVLREVVSQSSRVVVMSRRAQTLVTARYGANSADVSIIPHGVHPFPFVDEDSYKGGLGLRGRKVLLTFGLLHRNKGIEHAIDALPAIVERYPQATYVVLGATHPNVVREDGEEYRRSLERRVAERGLKEHVQFYSTFVDLPRLLEFIGAADVALTPYLNMDVATSGVLSYALAMGKAIVSTPYRYARELLAEGRGRLTPPADPDALAREVISLLGDERKTNAMRRNAYEFSRAMTWPVVAEAYVNLFNDAIGKAPPPRTARPVTPRAGTTTRRLGAVS